MKKRLLITSIVMMLVVAVALSTATYAWFTSNTNVQADAVLLTAATMDGDAILISHNKNNTSLSNAIVLTANDSLKLYPATPNDATALTAATAEKFINLQIDGTNNAKKQTITSPTASYYTDTFYVYNKGFSEVTLTPTVSIYFNGSNGASTDAAKSVRIAIVETVGSQVATSNATGFDYSTATGDNVTRLVKIYQFDETASSTTELTDAITNYIPAPATYDGDLTYYTDRDGTPFATTYPEVTLSADNYATYKATLFVPATVTSTHKNVAISGATGNYGAVTVDQEPSASSVYTKNNLAFTETSFRAIPAPSSNYYVANEYIVIVWLEGWDTECTNAMSAGLFRIDLKFAA